MFGSLDSTETSSGLSQKATSSLSEKAMAIHTASDKLDDDHYYYHMANNEDYWRPVSLGQSSHDKAILTTSKSAKEVVHYSLHPENHRRAAQIIGSASTSQPSDIGEVDIPSTRTTCEGIHGNFDSKGFSGVVGANEDPISGDLFPVTAPNESQGSKGKGPRESLIDYVTEATQFSNTHDSLLINHHTHMPNNEDHWRSVSLRQSSHDKAILPTSKSAKETVLYSLHPENHHRAYQRISPASINGTSRSGSQTLLTLPSEVDVSHELSKSKSPSNSRDVPVSVEPFGQVTHDMHTLAPSLPILNLESNAFSQQQKARPTIFPKETVHYSLHPKNHHRADQRIGPASMSQPSDIGESGIASTRTTCKGIHGNFTSEGSSRFVGANEDSISGDLFPVTAPNETQVNKGKRPRESLVVNVTEATQISNNHDSSLNNHHSNETSRSGSQTSKNAKETVHYSLHPKNDHRADESIGPASMSQPSDIGEVGIPSTRTTCEGIHGKFTTEGSSRVVGANEDPISEDLVPVTAPNESQGNKGKRPRDESHVVNVTEATQISNNHDSLLINHHSNETPRSEVDASYEVSKSKSPSNSSDFPVSVEPVGEVTRDGNTLAPSLPIGDLESNAFPQQKRVRHTIFPKDVPSLLITGVLDGAPVFYYDYKTKVKKWALIKQDCYLCGCLNCRFLRPVSACDFVLHCGVSTRRANRLIFFKSGFSVDRVVKEIQKTPPEKMFETLVSLTDSAINEQNFRNWSWRSNVDASNKGVDRGTQNHQPIEKQGTRS